MSSNIPVATAKRILEVLEKGEVIKMVKEGKGRKGRVYIFPKLIKITG